MDTAVLTTLLFNTAGILVFALGMVLAYCLPNRHRTLPWVLDDADVAARPVAPEVKGPQAEVTKLPHAA
jgi:hypothetical protein